MSSLELSEEDQKIIEECEVENLSNEELKRHLILVLDQTRYLQQEKKHLSTQLLLDSKTANENEEKIKLNTQLPHLIANVSEIIEVNDSTAEQSGIVDSSKNHNTKSVVLKTSFRQTIYLQAVGIVPIEELKPNDRVGVNKETYLILNKLPPEYDARAKAMELDERPKETYNDLGGLDKQVQELIEAVVLPMTNPERFEKLGIKPPKGVLMYGPPGTGKTSLARACAAQCSATFLRLAGSELVQMYIGDGAKIIRDTFELARKKAPSIIFIDEIDAIGSKRGDGEGNVGREFHRTMLELLNQLDGFKKEDNIKVIAATNREDILDPALMRSGRLDRKIEFPIPDEVARKRIFEIHSRLMAVDKESVVFLELARLTDGFNAAQIRACCIEAGMAALRENCKKIRHEHFIQGVDTVIEKKLSNLSDFS